MSEDYEKEADELVATLSKVGLQMREEGLQCAILCLEEKIKALYDIPISVFSGATEERKYVEFKYKYQIKYLKSKLNN